MVTRADPTALRAPDLLQRDFTATRPDRSWVADFTYCSTWSGIVYVAFVVDVFSRRIVGWKAASTMATSLVLDALNMAAWTRRGVGIDGVVCHSDAGSQGGFKWSSQHLETEVVRDDQQAPAPADDPRPAREDVVAGSAVDGSAPGSSPVLGGDRPRSVDRGRRWQDRRVIRGWGPMVPGGWRDASLTLAPVSGRYLSFAEREDIAILHAQKLGVRARSEASFSVHGLTQPSSAVDAHARARAPHVRPIDRSYAFCAA